MRYATAIYQVGSAEPFFHILAVPGVSSNSWASTASIIADYFQCEAEDVASREDDDGVELIMIRGEVVGSFNRPIASVYAGA